MGGMAAMAGISLIGGAITAGMAKKAAGRAEDDARQARAGLAAVKAARVPIINPYADNSNLSDMAKDLSNMLSNPYGSLGVATQAAEIQIEQSNIALSNALDTLATTGASAGGATALAQAALSAKKGVAASIEQQEAANEKLRAQGKSQLEQAQMSEAQRVQNLQISEGQRMQSQDAAGKQFVMQMKEQRSMADLDYQAGKESQAMANQASANAAQAQAWGSAISGAVGSVSTLGAANIASSTDDYQVNMWGKKSKW
tara:strand:+ start:402 stop:1172 length:771 start_codon:yes stop_codon:yes gene_type:complete